MYMPTNTHLLTAEFDYVRPASLADALSCLAEHGDQARLIAGGTDLLVQMKMEKRSPKLLVSLGAIPELRNIEHEGGLTLGAMVSIHRLGCSTAVRCVYTALHEACHAFSTTQVMMMGTIGGNLCNASPAADIAPALFAFDARLNLISAAGARSVSMAEFFTGPGKTSLASGEMVSAIEVPEPETGTGSAFLKIGRVAADISQVCTAVKLVREGSVVRDCRIALGAVAPTPVRLKRAESSLAGANGGPEAFARAAEIASEDIVPISDVRATEAYRRQAAKIIVRDALTAAWMRAAKGTSK